MAHCWIAEYENSYKLFGTYPQNIQRFADATVAIAWWGTNQTDNDQ